VLRGYNNVATLYLLVGRVEEGRVAVLETLRLAEHFGHYGYARFAAGGPRLGDPYYKGRWDEVVDLTEAFLAEVASGSPHYQASGAHSFRGLVRLARGDDLGAESDADRGVELVRPIRDPQALLTVFAMAALIFDSVGNERRAAETLDEYLEAISELQQIGFAVVWAHATAWVAWNLGRGDEFLAAVSGDPLESPWLDAARAVASGDFRAAADVFEGIGVASHEAFYRLRSAEQLVSEGRRAEADEQLAPALAFYRAVGATRYVREGEALLAASA